MHTEAEVIQQSANLLQSYLSDLLHAILQSASYCPVALCQAFQQLYQRVHKRFPEPEYRVRMMQMSILTCFNSKELIWSFHHVVSISIKTLSRCSVDSPTLLEWALVLFFVQNVHLNICLTQSMITMTVNFTSLGSNLVFPYQRGVPSLSTEGEVHSRYQFPVSALHLSGHHVPQTLPPSRKAR